MWSVRISACKSQVQTMAAQSIPRVRRPKNEASWNSTPVTAVISFESRKAVTEGLCPESRRPTPFESASAVKYLRLPTALRSKPAYRTPCSSKLSAQRGMNLLASPTLCGPRFWKNSNGSETKIKPNNKSTVRLLVNSASKNRRYYPDAAKLPANDSVSFSFRFMDVQHAIGIESNFSRCPLFLGPGPPLLSPFVRPPAPDAAVPPSLAHSHIIGLMVRFRLRALGSSAGGCCSN